ncbi:MAG TPA: hypothetical protein VGR28_12655 [Candidatus Thermoplasmatota archaeon]|jgi:hypothetical protein|nr:hypothetical protein [Candidatus Thermoplasmatota archaeon]
MPAAARHHVQPADVTLSTADAVRVVLLASGRPLSKAQILRDLAAQRRSMTRPKLNRILRYWEHLGLLVVGSQGVQWTGVPSAAVLDRLARARTVRGPGR